jgi:hypothetical protein
MPRIRSPSSASAQLKHAREYALLRQLPLEADGSVNPEVCLKR